MKKQIKRIYEGVLKILRFRRLNTKELTIQGAIDLMPMKPFLLMSTAEKVELLFIIFPHEVPGFLSFALDTAQLFIYHPERFREVGMKSIGAFGWQSLAYDLQTVILENRTLMEKNHHFMAGKLFCGWESVFAQYCLFAYKRKRKDPRFTKMVDRLFGFN